jgi:hypothetical protein
MKGSHLNGVDGSETWFREGVWESKLMMTLDHTSKRNGGSEKGILCPLSVADMLTLLINQAKTNGQIRGVIPHLVDDGLFILQYADDTIIFLDHDLEQAKNHKLLLCAFEQLPGLKINFYKSEVFCYGAAREMEDSYTSLFGCNSGDYLFRYLGIPMHHKQLLNPEWSKVEERFQQKL